MIKLSDYQITTPLAKTGGKVARTFQPGEDLTPAAAFICQGMCYAPTTGAATSSVHRTRSEIVGEPFYFWNSEQNLSLMTWTLGAINWAGKVVFQQMHCDDGNDPTLKLFAISADGGKTGRIDYGLRTTDSSADPKNITLLDNVDFSLPVTTSISSLGNGVVNISAYQGGNLVVRSAQLSAKRAARPHVFHWGVYNQVDMGNASEPAGDGSLLHWIDITELHGDIAPVPLTLMEQIDSIYNDWKDSKVTRLEALTALNALSKKVADVPDSKDRAPLYAQIKAHKADIG